MSEPKMYDFIIVGAGILGLTTALEIRRIQPASKIAVLEKETELGKHASGRNSGVLHAGIYYGSDTLKARVCSAGSKAMQAYADKKYIKMMKTGKVIVATRPETAEQIEVLQKRAEDNGVRVERLDAKALREIEPHAHSFGDALYSPDTAVIDSRAVMEELRRDLISTKIDLKTATEVRAADTLRQKIKTGTAVYSYGFLINCAGAHADSIAHMFGVGRNFAIIPFRGSYYRLSDEKNHWVKGSIYPAPDLRYPFLGVHLTRGISGEVYLGPTAVPAMGRENYKGLEGIEIRELPLIFGRLAAMYYRDENNFRDLVSSELAKYRKQRFLGELLVMVPGLEEKDLVVCNKTGIRPQLVNTSSWKLEMDFIIEKGLHSAHVLNAISPAFTGAFAFSKLIAESIFKQNSTKN